MAKTSLRKAQVDRPGHYVGETLNQVRHGQGKYVFNNTFFAYEGDWLEGSVFVSDFALLTNLYYSRGINSRVRRFIIKINIYK